MLTNRKATLDDCQLIHDMAWQVFPATYKGLITPEQCDFMMEWMYSLPNLKKQMTEEGHVYLLALKDGEPVGYVSVQQQGDNLFHLQKIYVLPSAQGFHVGRYLFEQAERYIKSVHPAPCRMELNVNRGNRAVGFYEHMGMRKDRQGDFSIGHGFYMNDYIMTKDL